LAVELGPADQRRSPSRRQRAEPFAPLLGRQVGIAQVSHDQQVNQPIRERQRQGLALFHVNRTAQQSLGLGLGPQTCNDLGVVR